MTDTALSALEFAADLAKQLITLATGIVALSITFAGRFEGKGPPSNPRLLVAAWCVFLSSVVFGIWTLMALTGELASAGEGGAVDLYGWNVRLPAMLQVLGFLVGIGLSIAFGALAGGRRAGADDGS